MGKRSRHRRREAAAFTLAVQQPAAAESPPSPDLVFLVRRRERLDEEIVREVRRLRAAGISWTVIGGALGVSRQGARQRYGP